MGRSIFTKTVGVFYGCALLLTGTASVAEYIWPKCNQGYWYHSGFWCDKCPDGFDFTDANASMVGACYRKGSSENEKLNYKTRSCPAGQYLQKGTLHCANCKEGYWCPGGIYGYDFTKDQGIHSCPSSRKYSAVGAKKVTQCYTNLLANGKPVSKIYFNDCEVGEYFNGAGCVKCPTGYNKTYANTTAIKPEECYNDNNEYYHEVKCSIGQYLPQGASQCAPCVGDSVCSFPHSFFIDQTKNQGDTYRCPQGYTVSSDHKECVQGSSGGNTGNECADGEYKDSQYGCIKCQAGFYHSDPGATSSGQCWALDTKNRKMYYKYIDGSGTEDNPKTCDSTANCTKCPNTTYVKKGTNWCSKCFNKKVCSGGLFLPSMNADLGISDADSHGCRISGTGSIQNGQYWENNKCKDCPNDFLFADLDATSRDQCYKKLNADGTEKLYYKKYHCDAGQYLPKLSSQCKICEDGYYCVANDYYPSLREDQGLKTCENGKVPNTNKTACEDSSSSGGNSGGGTGGNTGGNTGGSGDGDGITTCEAGKYLPAGHGKNRCENCPSGRKYCPGGKYQYVVSYDQGVFNCPTNAIANSKRDACIYYLSATVLKKGPNAAQTTFSNQCWTKKDNRSYARCLFPDYQSQQGALQMPAGYGDSASASATEPPAAS